MTLEALVQERWDIIQEIFDDYQEGFPFRDFEKEYADKLDNLGIESNKHTETFAIGGFPEDQKLTFDWYIGQIRDITEKNEHPDVLIGRALSMDPGTTSFYFLEKRFRGQNLHDIFAQTDRQKESQIRRLKMNYTVKKGWQEGDSFPGNKIFPRFKFGDRTSYEGTEVVILYKSEKPDAIPKNVRNY
ncbi:hypothetical protein HOA92_04400 [archaeon]|jgi:hypothetical protein|nr:hypothetical protein [archaeon]MBT6762256.1 hypothetical protein [archaeon]